MKHIGLFEGIGGFSLAARWMGWETVAWCEWNDFGRRVLEYHFPEAEGFGDITKTDFKKYADRIDILTGGFPCQPYSTAGKRLGKEDERHLWPEMLRAIREIRPRWVVGENVRGFISWNGGLVFDEVQADLEAEGYEVLPFLLPSCGVNAPHRRDRIWFVARRKGRSNVTDGSSTGIEGMQQKGENGVHEFNPTPHPTSERSERPQLGEQPEVSRTEQIESGGDNCEKSVADTECCGRVQVLHDIQQKQPGGKFANSVDESTGERWQNFPTQSAVCSGDDELSGRLDGITFSKWRAESVKAYGNAVVPELVMQIFKAIQQYEDVHP